MPRRTKAIFPIIPLEPRAFLGIRPVCGVCSGAGAGIRARFFTANPPEEPRKSGLFVLESGRWGIAPCGFQ